MKHKEVLRMLTNIYDEIFCENSSQSTVLNTPLDCFVDILQVESSDKIHLLC